MKNNLADRDSPGKIYQGVTVPMVTPLNALGELDEPAVRRIIDFMVTGGVQNIFVLGSTGEGPSVPREVRARLVHLTLEHTNSRARVLAGIASTVVEETIDAARDYLRRGVAAVVAPLPGYYTLTPDEQFQFFAAVLERARGPVLLYDIPPAVHMSIDQGVIEHLRVFPNLVGLMDSTGDSDRLVSLLTAYGDDPGFSVLVGTSSLVSFGLQHGADGFVSFAGNLNPALCARVFASARKGDWSLMNSLQQEIDTLQAGLGGETIGRSIARLKREMQKRGLCGQRVFPPLQEEEG